MRRVLLGLLLACVWCAPVLADIPTNLRITARLTPSGKVDTRYRDGNDGTSSVPLTWLQGCIVDLTFTQGAANSTSLLSCLEQPVPNTATFALLEDGAVSGVSLTANATISYSGTGTGTGLYRLRATRAGLTADSPQFRVTVQATGTSDVSAPTQVFGLAAALNASNKPVLTWTASSDPTVASATRSGLKEYTVRRGGSSIATVAAVDSGVSAAFVDHIIGTYSGSGSDAGVQSGSQHTLTASGAGFFGSADAGLFRSAPVSGDFAIYAKINSLGATGDANRKACLMARENATDTGGKWVGLCYSPNGWRFEWRPEVGAARQTGSHSAGVAPAYGMLVRVSGTNTWTGYVSSAGGAWSAVGTVVLPMANVVEAGLIASSNVAGSQNVAVFQQVGITQSADATYTDSSAGASTSYTYDIIARDHASNAAADSVDATILTGSGGGASGNLVRDCGFEGSLGCNAWIEGHDAPTVSTEQACEGTSSMKTVLTRGYPPTYPGANIRSEMFPQLNFSYGVDNWWAFCVYLPPSFVSSPVWEIPGQIHNMAQTNEGDLNPPFSLHTENDTWRAYILGDSRLSIIPEGQNMSGQSYERNSSFTLGPVQRGVWTRFVIHQRYGYTAGQNPVTQIWMNGQLVVNDTGINAFNDSCSFAESWDTGCSGPYVYWKMGLYKGWHSAGTTDTVSSRTLYHDALRISVDGTGSYDLVAPR